MYIYMYIHVYALLHSYKICFQSNFFCWRPSQPGRLVKATMDNQHDDLGIGLQLLLGLLIFSPWGGHSHTEFFVAYIIYTVLSKRMGFLSHFDYFCP